jgi:pimeloyl-ACP methyl ester carboxylesterase
MTTSDTSRRSLRLLVAALVTFALLAGACSDDAEDRDAGSGGFFDSVAGGGSSDPGSGPTSPGDDRPIAEIEWVTSGNTHRGTMQVPLDHDDPDAGVIEIAVARRPAADPDERIGVVLVNPGGPGASGIELAGLFGFLFSDELLDRFDIVTWDPRGVGDSTQVRCGDGEFMDRYAALDPVPSTPASEAEVAALVEEFAELCDADSGWLLPHLHTEASARDMDLIRVGLGEEQINYLGFSYGTYLGATYAELFPDRVRAFVLDGAYSRSLGAVDLTEGQAIGFERSVETFFEWCRTRACSFDDGGDLGTEFDQLMESIRNQPLATDDADGRDLTVGLAWTGVVVAMYSPDMWSQLDGALTDARDQGDGTGLLLLADFYNERSPGAEYSTLQYAFIAYSCMDSPAPTPAEEAEVVDRVLAAAPRVGPIFVSTPSPCEHWPVDPVGTTEPFSVSGTPPILVIATTGDPATPYDWGVRLADELETGFLLTVEGNTHTAFAGGNRCVDRLVEAYLIDAAVPAMELRCAA